MDMYECHGHIFMDGIDFRAARRCHVDGADETIVRSHLTELQKAGVRYFRDGGDGLGVSVLGRRLAPQYGIEYRTPVFAIHRRGRYGSIVGRGYDSMDEYRSLVREAVVAGADFIKVMYSGILTFGEEEPISCSPLPAEEIHAMVDYVHAQGLSVMAHVNGAEAIRAAAEAGTDSIEHGFFTDDASLEAMAANNCIWVPTVAAAEAFAHRSEFSVSAVRKIVACHLTQIRRAADMGVKIASGSDSGAVGVPHSAGVHRELELLSAAGVNTEHILASNRELASRFVPGAL